MKLVIAEKPSVARSIAAVIGATDRQESYLQGKCCGEEFESKRSNTLFCSPNCRAKFYRQEAAVSRSRECVCGNCGKVFTTTRSDVKYCCEACQRKAHSKMRYRQKRAEEQSAETV